MKRSSKYSETTAKITISNLVFPIINEAEVKTVPVSLEQIIQMSEEMLPFENKRRKPSEAATYTPFVLR